MKITTNLTHIATEVEFEPALTEEQLKEAFGAVGLKGFPAELDIAERTEEHVQMMALDSFLGFAQTSGVAAVTYDVTYFPHADDAEVTYQLKQLARELEISADVIRDVCADEIREYLELDAKRDANAPVHSIVECYVGGTAFAWYGMNEYPRLKRIILRKHPEQFNDQWAADVPFELPIKLPRIAPEDCEVLGEQQAVYSRCDMNGHLNNTRYADIVCDAVPWEVWDTAQIRDFTISYHREVPRGECFTLRRARLAEDTFYFDGEREGKSAFEAQLIFKHL
mgnify:CR=1 FL=1